MLGGSLGASAALPADAAYPGKPMRILALPEVRAQYLAVGLNAVSRSQVAFGAYIETEREKRIVPINPREKEILG